MFSPASNDAGASNCRRRPRRIRCRHVSTASPFVRRFALPALLSALLLPHFVIAAERPAPAQAGRAPVALALLSVPGRIGREARGESVRPTVYAPGVAVTTKQTY